ncbi:MAG TPA: D-aminoacylase [Steroidobacteraceae bacterium]|nr:D-aminoacylase [Steroidobacteraceae bacterium]
MILFHRILRYVPVCALLILATGCAHEAAPTTATTFVIVNAHIADGTGAPLRNANVRVAGDRIAAIGSFEPQPNEPVLDAKGRVLAPGFIDIHNHSDDELADQPLAESQIAQGITTVVLGLDGGSPWPIGDWLEARRRSPPSLNLAMMVGHATVRELVMKDDFRRTARPDEVTQMARLVEQGMSEGAIGLSSGLEYDVASYSDLDEMVAVAAAAAKHGGFYMSHVRDEAERSFQALDEFIAIGERAHIPLQHSHIKMGTTGVWGRAAEYIRVIETARARGDDLLADCYPYDAWHSNLKVIVPNKQYLDPASVQEAIALLGGPTRITITEFAPNRAYEKHTIAQLAQAANISPVEMYMRLIREGDAANDEAGIIGQSMTEADIEAFYKQPWVMVASDGGIGSAHPRGAGTFPRVLGLYVRERGWLTLPEAIRKMTALPAQRLGWKDRGILREGAIADLVLFDPDTVIDRSTFAEPTLTPVGIEKVFVNGVAVWSDGKATGERPGRVLPK